MHRNSAISDEPRLKADIGRRNAPERGLVPHAPFRFVTAA
jgi:hypothetical protein